MLGVTVCGWAQDSVTVPVQPPAPADTSAAAVVTDTVLAHQPVQDSVLLVKPISAGGALIRSLILPGWGQARLGRGLTAGFFLTVEGAALGMALKANSELRYMRATNDPRADSKSQEREDWLVILGMNHLLAGIEAYVSAYLWDFPGDLKLQATPYGASASVTFPVRLP